MLNILDELSKETFNDLCVIGTESDSSRNKSNRLIFPNDLQPQKERSVRVSEQEARILFIQNLVKRDFHYSIETPTINKYRFTQNLQSNNSKRSGSLDLCILKFNNNKYTRLVNLEFKSHNMKEYDQDFEKLCTEPANGMFFHLLKSMNNGTLNADASRKGVITKYRNAFRQLKKTIKKNNNWTIKLVIASLKPQILMTLEINNKNMDLKDLFDFVYSIEDQKITVEKENHWKILSI